MQSGPDPPSASINSNAQSLRVLPASEILTEQLVYLRSVTQHSGWMFTAGRMPGQERTHNLHIPTTRKDLWTLPTAAVLLTNSQSVPPTNYWREINVQHFSATRREDVGFTAVPPDRTICIPHLGDT